MHVCQSAWSLLKGRLSKAGAFRAFLSEGFTVYLRHFGGHRTMPTITVPVSNMDTKEQVETIQEAHYERWHHWHVNWSAVWVGSLAAIAAVLIFGLIGIAVGAHLLGPENRVVDLKTLGI